MKVAFDLHGTIDRSPSTTILMIRLFVNSGHEVYIISGPPAPEIKTELFRIDPIFFTDHITEVISIVDFAKADNVAMRQHQDGSWYCDDAYWWRSKGLICKKYGIDLLFDNEIEYGKNLPEETSFVHWDRRKL